ncbi:hypothetical protein PILCRDRAFT_830569 [Piloderma croceum F 1598]|uniref:Uncharacterized protein n=1 Tax=Piloderma croceum (strain F 1598) TaxID=765440 RepID=A0A0C3B183_PILCF|nr:hypothetical protein PILCRDRAFT_830569 [Piloderma croceum F 1598]
MSRSLLKSMDSEEIPVLSKGAILAQSPANFETIDVLDDGDREIIHYENVHKWSHPWTLYMTVIICSIGAATQLIFVLISVMYAT